MFQVFRLNGLEKGVKHPIPNRGEDAQALGAKYEVRLDSLFL